ncbi:VOC family protein [Alphaproteobacteria bacterium KMM 3653]|uniref:VOC family protein n=1 Tax=Harenicola maris TaxID=2841044 RepID=A0AAP2CSD3_9RHOB|nr:VOC family protein [Harenicola maris]
MQKVTGFGGFFFRAGDSAGLAKWYETHLGVAPVPTDADTPPWITQGGATVFAPFASDTDYFAADKAFMLNFRVDDLDAMVAQLRAAGITVKVLEDMEGIGRFAHLADPEGTPIELWQPA